MKKKARKEKTPLRIIVLNVLIVIAAFFLAGSIIALIGEVREDQYREIEPYSMVYRMESGDYSTMVMDVQEARLHGQDLSGELAEYAAVADYFKAASLYKAYEEEGRTTLAKPQAEAMEKAASEMGSLSGEKSRIDAFLGVRK